MAFVIELSRLNVEHGGGPFAAAVFSRRDHRLIAAAANRVVEDRCFLAHAEVLALCDAQGRVASRRAHATGLSGCELVSSTEPCLMCQGAVLWSGIGALVCGARGRDAEAIGFDEGPKHFQWVRQFEARGIRVRRDVLRAEAAAVLREYRQRDGVIY